MKLHVITDAEGNTIAAMKAQPANADGDRAGMEPAHDDHTVVTIDVPEEIAAVPAAEFGSQLAEHL